MVGFRVRNKDRLIGWIHCLAYRYYALLGEDEDYEVQWTDRQCAHNKDLHEEIQIQIFENNQEKRKVVTIHIFFTTFLITVQGTTYEEWARFEFQYLKGLVDGLCGENVDKLLQYLHVDEDIDEFSDAETELKLPANTFEHGNKSASFSQLDLLQASLIKTVEKLEASQESNTVAIIEAIKGIHTPNKIDVSQTQIPVLETKLKVLQSENSELKSQLNHEKDARCELKNLITSTRGEIDYLYDKIAQKNDHVESLELRNKHLSEMLSQTQDELFEVKSSAQRVERGPPEQHAMPAAAASLQQPAQDVGNSNFRKRCRDVTLFHPGIAQRYMFIIMADNNIEAECSDAAILNTNNEIKLCESIPGASLKGRKPKDLTTTELIRWLKCRQGASLKGRKADLVERYVNVL